MVKRIINKKPDLRFTQYKYNRLVGNLCIIYCQVIETGLNYSVSIQLNGIVPVATVRSLNDEPTKDYIKPL